MVTNQIPELTIIIPARNEEQYIKDTLSSLARQDYPSIATTPIYVADGQSNDRTREIVKQFQDSLNVSVIGGGLPSVGRNRGAAKAESEYVLFMDADIRLDPTTISRMLAFAKERGLHCVGANARCFNGKLFDRFIFLMCNASKKPYAVGMFLLFQKRAFDALGGFDERVSYGEDALLMKGVPRKLFGIVPGLFVHTSRRSFKRRGYIRGIWLAFLNTINLLIGNRTWFYKEHHWFD